MVAPTSFNTSAAAKRQDNTATDGDNVRPGVFKFVNGGVVLPTNFGALHNLASNSTLEPSPDRSFENSCSYLCQLIAAREIQRIPELARFVMTLALESDDPAIERAAINTLSIRHQFFRGGLPADKIQLREVWSPGLIDFSELAGKYFGRGSADYESGLAAAELLRLDLIDDKSVTTRIGRHNLIRNPGRGRGHNLHPFSEGLLLSGEVGAARIACDEIARSIGSDYASPRPFCWLVWMWEDSKIFFSPLWQNNAEATGATRAIDPIRDNYRLAYHLCNKLPVWPENIPRILEYIVDRHALPPRLNKLSSWRTP